VRALAGPPIHSVVATLSGDSSSTFLDSCVTAYRRHLVADPGAAPLFPGIASVLAALDGVALALASSKPVEISEPQLRALGVRDRFGAVEGSRLGERGVGKAEIVGRALAALGVDDAVMVGDRVHDVDGARAHGLRCIGVLWGYGSACELHAADTLVATPAELLEALSR
jgi:phosphoglycolate phosphatase